MDAQHRNPIQRTPLFSEHVRAGAQFVVFHGWEMPLFYSSIMEEHLAVRHAAGIFDISHMGEITVTGAAAGEFLNRVLTNDIRRLAPGRCQYSLMCNHQGGVIDDLYVCQLSEDVYLLVVNAARTDADLTWLQLQAAEFGGGRDLQLRNSSQRYAAVAIQGPAVSQFVDDCIPGPSRSAQRVSRVTELKKNEIGGFTVGTANVLISRTGYTGEDGFEIIGLGETIVQIWQTCLERGAAHGIKPCGLGARDTLRTEVCFPLYGNELDENTTPIEASLDRFVALGKDPFIGREVLEEQKTRGVTKKLIAFQMSAKSPPPRPGYPIRVGDSVVGRVTSGILSPIFQRGVGMGFVPPGCSGIGTKIQIEIRNQLFPAEVVPKPIYRRRLGA